MNGIRLALAALLSTSAVACGGFERLEFTFESAPPGGATVTNDEIRIHEGIAVGVFARPMEGDETDDEMDEFTSVELASKHPQVLDVAKAVHDPEVEGRRWEFVLFGRSAGTTTVVVRIDGEDEAEIPAFVESQ